MEPLTIQVQNAPIRVKDIRSRSASVVEATYICKSAQDMTARIRIPNSLGVRVRITGPRTNSTTDCGESGGASHSQNVVSNFDINAANTMNISLAHRPTLCPTRGPRSKMTILLSPIPDDEVPAPPPTPQQTCDSVDHSVLSLATANKRAPLSPLALNLVPFPDVSAPSSPLEPYARPSNPMEQSLTLPPIQSTPFPVQSLPPLFSLFDDLLARPIPRDMHSRRMPMQDYIPRKLSTRSCLDFTHDVERLRHDLLARHGSSETALTLKPKSTSRSRSGRLREKSRAIRAKLVESLTPVYTRMELRSSKRRRDEVEAAIGGSAGDSRDPSLVVVAKMAAPKNIKSSKRRRDDSEDSVEEDTGNSDIYAQDIAKPRFWGRFTKRRVARE